MQREQLPEDVSKFAAYFEDLLSRLDQVSGWCGVFWQRDPEGMTACLDGVEVPPWDVVQALLHDLAADRGTLATERETALARALHAAALTAHDARPGARELLGDRLVLMLAEQRYAAERQADLATLLAGATPQEAEQIRLDLAWARDDHERATARSEELRARIEQLEHARVALVVDEGVQGVREGRGSPAARSRDVRAPARKRKPRGARFAGVESDDGEIAEDAAVAVPDVFAAAPVTTATPRGARYAGAAAAAAPEPEPDVTEKEPDGAAARTTARAVTELLRLRAEGRSGEAHAVLCEAVHWPAPRLPLLADELQRAGLTADWLTLLWEAASLPVERLVAAADALAAAGRVEDGGQLLRQGVARPAPEIADVVLALDDAGRKREVAVLLDAYVRVRVPEEVAQVALCAPGRLAARVIDAARAVSREREWDVVHALRVAGISV